MLLCFSLLVVRAQAVSFQQPTPQVSSTEVYNQAQGILSEANTLTTKTTSLYDKFQTMALEDFASTILHKYSRSLFKLKASTATSDTETDKQLDEQIQEDFQDLGEFKFIESPTLDEKTNLKMNFMALHQPLHSSKIGSRFGMRHGRAHTGTDFPAPVGTAIMASSDGKVISTGFYPGYGQLITLDHGDGILTRYAHCSRILVQVGQQVKQGQVIGKVGTTGRSTGPHLHFELIADGYHLNPELYLASKAMHTAHAHRVLDRHTWRAASL